MNFLRIYAILFVAFVRLNYVNCDKEYSICNSKTCNNIATSLRSSMDWSVDPCEDIYQHVCGDWQKYQSIIPSLDENTTPNLLEQARTRYQEILKETSKPEDLEQLKFARNVYKMCVDSHQRDLDGLNVLHSIIDKIGVWPLINPDDNALGNTTWQEISMKIDLYFTSNIIYSLDVSTSERKTVTLSEPDTLLPGSKSVNRQTNPTSAKLAAYRLYIQTVAEELMRGKKTVAPERVNADIENIIKFETEILKILTTYNKTIDERNFFRSISVNKLQRMYNKAKPKGNGQINWHDIVENKLSVSNSESCVVVDIYNRNYFTRLAKLLDATPTRTIVNYHLWHFVRSLLPYTTMKMQNLAKEAKRISYRDEKLEAEEATNKNKSLADECLDIPNVQPVVEYEYIKRYFPHEARQKVFNILSDLKNVVVDEVSNATWINSAGKNAFINKIKSTSIGVSHPDWYSDDAMKKHYATLNLTTSTLLESVLNIMRFFANDPYTKFEKSINGTNQPVDDFAYEELTNLLQRTVRYNGSLIYPFWLFHKNLFDLDRPESMNYGTVGFDLGRDIAFGFGNLYNETVMHEKDFKALPKQGQNAYTALGFCIFEYYIRNMETVAKKWFIQTIADFIGDLSAISSAWNNWYNYTQSTNSTDVRLPGLLQYTSDHLFFISIAYNNCANNQTTDNHIRLSNIFANSEAFNTVFGCTQNQRMNPEKKCNVWA